MTEQEAMVALNAVPGLSPAKAKLLIAHYKGTVELFKQNQDELISSGIVSPHLAQNIVHFSKDKFLLHEYNQARQKGIHLLTIVDSAFPAQLKDVPGGPIVLYVKGEVKHLSATSIAMVGSRICSHYGLAMAEKFAYQLAQAGCVIVSGLARGIDTAAHKGCLKADKETIAVTGCGLNYVYPRENKQLMEQIASKGVVVSEMPLDTVPIPAHFPRRNRIISGLSIATVVVEAGEKSGALITADFALEQGREVFAIPANIDYTSAKGSNRLLKDGAKLVLDPKDILEEIRGQVQFQWNAQTEDEQESRISVSEDEMKIYRILTSEPRHFDELVFNLKSSSQVMAVLLLNLEMKGIIRQLPGRFFVKV